MITTNYIACLFYCLRKEPYLSYIWFLLNMNNSFFLDSFGRLRVTISE